MNDDLFFGARSSLFVSNYGLLTLFALAVLSAMVHYASLCVVFAFLFFFCAVSRLWGEASLRRVDTAFEAEPTALFPGNGTEVCFRIRNGKWLPVIWMELVQPLEEKAPLIPADSSEICRMDDEEGLFLHKKFTFVMGHEEILWRSRWTASRRGLFRPAQMHLQAGDGFGLTQAAKRISGSKKQFVAVYPALQPVSVDLFLKDMWDASSGAKGYMEDPTIIKSTRDYTPADPAKRINWRLTARGQKTVINTYETILPRSAHFIVDCESFNGYQYDEAAFEDMLSILTSVLVGLRESGVLCSVSLPKSRHAEARDILGAEETPLEEILLAFAGYTLRELETSDQAERPPYALPAVFRESSILALQNVGRYYYVCASLEKVKKQRLLTRLESSRTVLLPYELPEQSKILPGFSVVGLKTLKRGHGDGT